MGADPRSARIGKRPLARRPAATRRQTLLVVALAAAAGAAQAQDWRVVPFVSLRETFTNNVDLEPDEGKRSDFVTEITPGVSVSGRSARASLSGTVSVPMLLYARTGSENNDVIPAVSLNGSLEAIENFFFVDGSINVSQEFLTPFGAQPADLANVSNNRYTSAAYSVSPYIKGVTRGNISYLLRNNNTWTNLSGSPIAVDNAYYNQWVANVASPVAPVGWAVDAERNDVRFNNQEPQLMQLARLRGLYNPNALWQLGVSVGYEDNRFPLTEYSGMTYGAGALWRPTERTTALARWEHRFFGSSYLATFDHRTPLTVWHVDASRNISSYPQNFATLPAGGNVSALLGSLLTSRIPDPTQRQTVVDQFIQDRGLPATLSSPVPLYTQQITLEERQNASVGIIGARNTIFLSGYQLKSTPIEGSGTALPSNLAGANDNTQRGGAVTWTLALAPRTSMRTTASTLLTLANGSGIARSSQSSIDLTLNSTLSPRTSVFAGARYQVFGSNVAADYDEAAVFAGFSYSFR